MLPLAGRYGIHASTALSTGVFKTQVKLWICFAATSCLRVGRNDKGVNCAYSELILCF